MHFPKSSSFFFAAMAAMLTTRIEAQRTVAVSFAPGGRELALLDFSTFPLGPVSSADLTRTGMYDLRGQLEVVMKDGVHMLRAAEPSTFRVRIPEVLPNDFTIEFDLIPKNCCNSPQDLSVEGTSEIRQDAVSAHLLWRPSAVQVIGGVVNQSYDKPMPAALSAVLPGSLANIAVSVQGRTLRMYTNGQELYVLDRAFARGRVLRVFLGGQLRDRNEPVYLARLRIGAGAPVTLPTITPTVTAPSSPGSTTGIVRTGATSPAITAATTTSTGNASIVSRTVPLAGFTAAGPAHVASRTLMLAGFTAAGITVTVPSRAITLAGFTAHGAAPGGASRTITLTGFTAAGTAAAVASRTISLAGWTAGQP